MRKCVRGRLSRFEKTVAKIHKLVKFIFMHNLHFLPFKNVEISTLVKICKCICNEYACIKSCIQKTIVHFYQILVAICQILEIKNRSTSRVFTIFGIMFFWYKRLCINLYKKNFYAFQCINIQKSCIAFLII